MKLRHEPGCAACNLDNHERYIGGTCQSCWRGCWEKDLFEWAVFGYLIVVLIMSLWPVLS